jgi:hypothetical protein
MLRWLASGGSGKRWEVEVSLKGVGKPMGERARVRLGESEYLPLMSNIVRDVEGALAQST